MLVYVSSVLPNGLGYPLEQDHFQNKYQIWGPIKLTARIKIVVA